jgi:hypothetical protein
MSIEQIRIFPNANKMTVIYKTQDQGTKILVINGKDYEDVKKAISGKGRLMPFVKNLIKED